MIFNKAKVLIKKFKEAKKDGWTFREIVTFILDCMDTLIDLGRKYTNDISEIEIKDNIVNELKTVYNGVRVKVSWLPLWLQSGIEVFLLNNVLPPLVDWFWDKIVDKIK